MPTPGTKESWDSQYQSDFRPRRYPRQVAARPTSGNRRHNPHPIKDFLLYNRHKPTAEEEVHSIIRTAILRSAPAVPGGYRDLSSIPVGPLASVGETEGSSNQRSQCPKTPRTDRPRQCARFAASPKLPVSARNAREASGVAALLSYPDPAPATVTTMAKQEDKTVIMNRGLSPRRAAPPSIPPRTMRHYGSFGNREEPNPYIGALDLYASPYNANRGFNQGFTDYSTRQSRPMHRHMRTTKKGEDYLHNNSIYYSTTPNVSGYFIIHPDWVSERLTLRRSQSLLSF